MDGKSSKSPRSEDQAAHHATFEETYPRYEFAELVRLTLVVASWLAGLRHRLGTRRRDLSSRPSPGEMSPAE